MTKSEHKKRNTILNLVMLAALIGFLVWGQEGAVLVHITDVSL